MSGKGVWKQLKKFELSGRVILLLKRHQKMNVKGKLLRPLRVVPRCPILVAILSFTALLLVDSADDYGRWQYGSISWKLLTNDTIHPKVEITIER
jgi:hypothetical protein